MAARLGNVAYWTACILAVAWIAMVYFGIESAPKPDWSMFFMVGALPAFIIWAIGRAVRYVLSAQ